MPAATTKADLIAVTEKDWAKLEKLLDTIPAELADVKDADDTSITDILTHRAHWIGLFFQWLEEGQAAQMPDHGVKWNQLKAYNAALREKYAEMSWEEALEWLTNQNAKLLTYMQNTPETDLYGAPMPGGTGWTTGRYVEASGPSHYRSAAKYIRARLKSLSPA
ncbi:MAG: ClbS/DfsB family four-helix bundle protein [Pseudomonadota bacterium]